MKKVMIFVLLFAGLGVHLTADHNHESVTTSKGTQLTGEKWFDWNGTDWIITQYDEYRFDSLNEVTQLFRYNYNSLGILSSTNIYNRNDYEGYYTLSYSYTWTGASGKEGGTYWYIYKYDLTGLKTGYTYSYDYWSIMGGSNTDNVFTYTYTDGNLTNIYETYSYFEYKSGDGNKAQKNSEYTYSTDYVYDAESRILTENKKSLVSSVWTDIERTTWTYDGDTGTGLNETFNVDQWVNANKKTRTFDGSGNYIFEQRELWTGTEWAESQTDELMYDADGDMTEVQTKVNNSVTGVYDNFKKHLVIYDLPSGIEENIPQTTELYQNYPNPCNPVTRINYALPQASNVELNVYNLNGQLVQSLVKGKMGKGIHKAEFNAGDLTSGMYVYNLKVDNKVVSSKKMMLLK
jgi:hypothetical protein